MVTTNIETIKISELPSANQTASMKVPATNGNTNQSYSVDLSVVDKAVYNANTAANAAGVAAAGANSSAKAADDARNAIQTDLAGKVDLDSEKKYVSAQQLDPRYGYQTGAVMGKGVFKSTDRGLLPAGDWSLAILFTTGPNVTAEEAIFLNHSLAKNTQLFVSGGYVYLQWVGNGFARAPVKPNSLHLAVFTYDQHINAPTLYVNNSKYLGSGSPLVPQAPNVFRLGSGYNSDFKGVVHSCRMFNFALSAEQTATLWNGGHPELWRVPDVWRVSPSAWTESSVTFSTMGNNTVKSTGLAADSGFSGSYDRYENTVSPASYWGAYCSWRMGRADEKARYQSITLEYRSDAELRFVNAGLKTVIFPANTGNAVCVKVHASPGYYGEFVHGNKEGGWFEMRVISLDTVGCLLDLVPAGLLKNVWRDLSGQHTDIPYLPAGDNPAEATFSYQNVGFQDVLSGGAAPTVAPDFVGQTYIDTANKNIYKAVGTTTAADWKIV